MIHNENFSQYQLIIKSKYLSLYMNDSNTTCKVSYMTVISTPATPPHVVSHNLRGKWEGDALPPARGWHASKLHQQHRTTIWSWGGPPLSAERYKNALMEVAVDLTQDSNNLSWPITFTTAFALLGLKESPGMPWAHSSLLAETIDEARRQLGVTYEQDNLQWCVLSNS